VLSQLRNEVGRSVLAVLVLTALLGVAYPLLIYGIGQGAFPGNANGQLVYRHGQLVGSKIIGQDFADPVYRNGRPLIRNGEPVTVPDPRYFQTRPSATVPPDNDAATTFSNLGPNNVATEREISANIAVYIALNGRYYPGGLDAAKVPVDAADTSASGVDPDISIANADIQAHRVAAVDHLKLGLVRHLIARYTSSPWLGFSGEPSVDVQELNLAVQRLIGGSR
jgi:K+-transporting ATPase ATPase C chain